MSDLTALFEGTDLSEEFKEKAQVIFTAAIDEKVAVVKTELETTLKEEYEGKVETKLQELEEAAKAYLEEEVMPTVDKYLTAATNDWLKENTVALEANGTVALAESFLTGLTGLAADHRLTLPEGKDPLEALQKKVDELSETSKQLLDSNIELQKENTEFKKNEVLAQVTESLSESQKEKFAGVVKSVEFKTAEQYATALKSLSESYFPVNADNQNDIVNEKKDEVKTAETIVENLTPEEKYYKSFNEAYKKS